MRSFFRQFLPRQNHPQEITYKELDSKLIKAARYDLAASHLYIRFHDGRELVYCRVTPYAYNAFLNADSFSDHFHSFISQRYLNYQVM
ncbi:KTSC domain-containing protein [Brevibacillus sp. M2.1A]|uniref:KTSC domain-containing protein n=1 Tax=Brevibacillus TaxID=55080 RepID=UPI00156AF066|nr:MULTISPECIES: KTSC domain-containing protein [Brevibacillus]MBY0085278.1 KTSC domain-containing protein [Brevibacillus brevis]MCC8434586.1 KTSC domain-containing protein [Brevibacillus sp. M2.1A]MCE0450351.1 KTSC domain-containing protein [Brevibacillus sp. AF8]MCM3146380.1 KTSC domain-containing protein [Brevibacillus sp. MER 51]UKK96990.1 KTSC domain-containing protein [Brevibacillus brevis]